MLYDSYGRDVETPTSAFAARLLDQFVARHEPWMLPRDLFGSRLVDQHGRRVMTPCRFDGGTAVVWPIQKRGG